MAESNTTKQALASSLKTLMAEKPFEKISISDICEKCHMNRKSFYYHFKDKYDLVNWIFDTEFIAIAQKKTYEDSWELFEDIAQYFYENRIFYRKALSIQGQNSFSEHFRELWLFIISSKVQEILGAQAISGFQRDFFADAIVMSFQRWILEYTSMEPGEFLEQLNVCVKYLADSYEEIK